MVYYINYYLWGDRMDDELLTAIKEMIAPLAESVAKLEKGQQVLTQGMVDLTESQQEMHDSIFRTRLQLENEIGPQIKAIYEGHEFTKDRTMANEDTIEETVEKMDHHDLLIKSHDARIKKLEQEVG